jgi:hypothetical protein
MTLLFTTPCGHKVFEGIRQVRQYLRSHPRVSGLRVLKFEDDELVLMTFRLRTMFGL